MTTPTPEIDALTGASVDAFASACGLLCDIFNLPDADWSDLHDWNRLVVAMRVFPDTMQVEYFKPIITKFFATLDLDPTDATSREEALKWVPNMVAAIDDVAAMIYQAVNTETSQRKGRVILPGR